MIDYDRLKYAHKLTEKLPYEDYSFDCWCNCNFESGYLYVLSFDDEKNITHEYESENIEDLIVILEDIVNQKKEPRMDVEVMREINELKALINDLLLKVAVLHARIDSFGR